MMCALCCTDRHETPQLGCPGANATGPQRIRWNWNAKYRRHQTLVFIAPVGPKLTFYDANWQPVGYLVSPPE